MNRFFCLLLTGLILVLSAPVNAQQLALSDAGSTVKFSIKNFGLTTNGSFRGLGGKITYDAGNPTHSTFDVFIQASSIETGNNTRDRHLRGDDYFDVEQFPRITLKSESVSAGPQSGAFILHGLLGIRGITRKIDLPFTIRQENGSYIFEGNFTVNRLDYHVGSSSISLSDNASIYLKVIAKN